MQLVVAVDTVTTPAGVFAAAVAYPADKPEPHFQYKDGRRTDRTRPWFTTAQRLPDYLRTAIVNYVRTSAVCYVVLRTRGGESDALATKALARAIEKLTHDKQVSTPESVRVVAFTRAQFEGARLPSLTTYARTAEYPWFLGAAHILTNAAVEHDMVWSEL